MGLYLLVPILRKWLKQATRREIEYFLGLWVLALLLELPSIKHFIPINQLLNFSGYVGYMILGYYLSTYSTILDKKYSPLSLFVVGSSVTIIGTYWLSNKSGEINFAFYEFLTPNVLISSVGIFLFVKNSSSRRPKVIDALVDLVSTHSFGVYLIHILVLDALYYLGISWKMCNPVVGIFIMATLCLIISLMIIAVLKQIPILKNIAG